MSSVFAFSSIAAKCAIGVGVGGRRLENLYATCIRRRKSSSSSSSSSSRNQCSNNNRNINNSRRRFSTEPPPSSSSSPPNNNIPNSNKIGGGDSKGPVEFNRYGGGNGSGNSGGNSTTAATAASAAGTKEILKEKGPVNFASLLIAAVAGLSLVTYFKYEKDQKIQNNSQNKVTSYGKASVGGPWCLVDSEGNIKTDLDYRGKFLLLYFGFTYCPDICPTELVKINKVMKELEKRKCPVEVKPIFISVDPVRDTVGQLRNYMQDFHPSMEYLTGTPEQIYSICRAFRVYFNKTDDEDEDEEYLVDHSIVVYCIDPEGEFLDFYTQKMDAKDIADKIINKASNWKPNQPMGIQVSEQRK